MSNFQDEATIARTRFSNWALTNGVSVLWDDFNAPTQEPPRTTPWARMTLRGGETLRASLGPNARRRTRSSMIVQVFVPVGTGDSSLRSLLDSLADHFRDYQQDGVSFWEPSIRVVGQDPEGPWFQGNVSVPIMRDRIV